LKSTLSFILNVAFLKLKFKKSTYEHFNIRLNEFSSDLLFPVCDLKNNIVDLVRIKENALKDNKLSAYGPQLLDLPNHKDQLIISDSILNAFSLYESLNMPVLILKSDTELPDRLKIYLEKFNKIIIWLNDKQVAWNLAEQLNSQRCFLISHSKSPFDCFNSNIALKKIVSYEQFSLKNDGLIQLKDMINDVYDEVSNLKKIAGTKWSRFPALNEYLKGFRPGELTIFTGQTGAGKTTFLSEYSIDLCVAGVPTLWGSFEIKNSRLAKMMMTQYSG
jgi:twinkle protein